MGRACTSAALLAVAVAGVGCRTPDPAAFAAYRDAVDRVGEGSQQLLRQGASLLREGYADRFDAEGRHFAELQLSFELAPAADPACPVGSEGGAGADGDDGAVDAAPAPPPAQAGTGSGDPIQVRYAQPPAFALVERAALALDALGEAASLYAGLLTRLAGDERVPASEFERLARSLDARTRSAAARFSELGVTSLAAASDAEAAAGLVSLGVAGGARLWAARRQRRELRHALARNQERIEAWACAAREALTLVGDDLAFEYGERFRTLSRAHQEATRPAGRRARVGEALALNAEVQAGIASLRGLWSAYGSMPGAHRSLLRGLDSRGAPRDELRALVRAAGRLDALPGARRE